MADFLELLKKRRSTRVFSGEPVSEDNVCTLMKAALMSPSGHRINPWEFILVEDKEVLKSLSVSKEHGGGTAEFRLQRSFLSQGSQSFHGNGISGTLDLSGEF